MTKDEALKMALEALETNNKAWKHLADSGDAGFWEAEEQPFYEVSVKAITAIKEALAQRSFDYKEHAEGLQRDYDLLLAEYNELKAQRTWVGLTDEEMKAVCAQTWSYDPYLIANAIEAKLKEKNI